MTCSCIGGLGAATFLVLSKKHRFLESVKKGSEHLTTEYLISRPQLLISVTLFGDQNALHLAALHGHLHLICNAIEALCQATTLKWRGSGALKDNRDIQRFINSQDAKGCTPLLLAVRSGHLNCARQLLASGANVTILDRAGNSALHYGAAYGRVSFLNALIHEYKNTGEHPTTTRVVDIRNASGYSPLHYAVWCKNTSATRFLLQCGADITVANTESELDPVIFCCVGSTPLHIAAAQSQPEIARLILKAHYERNVEPFLLRDQEPEARDPRTIPNQEGKMPYQVARALGARNLATLLHPSIAWTGLFAGMESHPRFYGPRPLKAIAAKVVNKQLLAGLDRIEAKLAEQSSGEGTDDMASAKFGASVPPSVAAEAAAAVAAAAAAAAEVANGKASSLVVAPSLSNDTTRAEGKDEGTWSVGEACRGTSAPAARAKSTPPRGMSPLAASGASITTGAQPSNAVGAASGDAEPWEDETSTRSGTYPNNSGWRSRWPFKSAIHGSIRLPYQAAYWNSVDATNPHPGSCHCNATPCTCNSAAYPGQILSSNPPDGICPACGTPLVATPAVISNTSNTIPTTHAKHMPCPNEDCMLNAEFSTDNIGAASLPRMPTCNDSEWAALGGPSSNGGNASPSAAANLPYRSSSHGVIRTDLIDSHPCRMVARTTSGSPALCQLPGVDVGDGHATPAPCNVMQLLQQRVEAGGDGELGHCHEGGCAGGVLAAGQPAWDDVRRRSACEHLSGDWCPSCAAGMAGHQVQPGRAKRCPSFPGSPRRYKAGNGSLKIVIGSSSQITGRAKSDLGKHGLQPWPATASQAGPSGCTHGRPHSGRSKEGQVAAAELPPHHPFAVVSHSFTKRHEALPVTVEGGESGRGTPMPGGEVARSATATPSTPVPLVRSMSLNDDPLSASSRSAVLLPDDEASLASKPQDAADDDGDDECGVCMERPALLSLLPCAHHLCLPCTRKLCSMRSTRTSICPFCRHLIAGFGPPKGVEPVTIGRVRPQLAAVLSAKS